MGVADNIAAVRANAGPLSEEFFIHFFKTYPQHKKQFPHYKDVDDAKLKDVPSFSNHVIKVVSMILDIAEHVGDAGALKANGQKVAKMSQHTKLGAQEYKDVFAALVTFLQAKLGGACATADWQSAAAKIVAAIEAGM